MRLNLILAGMLLALLAAPVFANRMTMSVDEKVEKLQSKLGLTDEQAKEIRPIIKDYVDAMREAKDEKEDRLQDVLTPEQMKELKSIKMEKHAEEGQ